MRTLFVSHCNASRAQTAAVALVAALAVTVLVSAACAADTVVTVTASQPGIANLGAPPPVGAGRRLLVTGKLVGFEPPPTGAVSIEVRVKSPDGQIAKEWRYSPYPASRVDPQVAAQHLPVSIPIDKVQPGTGGNWQAEFRITTSDAPATVRAQFAEVKFTTVD